MPTARAKIWVVWSTSLTLIATVVWGIAAAAPFQPSDTSSKSVTQPQSNSATPEQSKATTVYQSSVAAIVKIVAKDSKFQEISQGTGFFLSSDGLVATNFHVISDAHFVEVVLPTKAQFTFLGVHAISKDRDIAILKVDAVGMAFLALAEDTTPAVGSEVFAIGNPQGLEATLSSGIVSAVRGDNQKETLIQTTCPISKGSSGGPLLNSKSEVLGITSFYLASGQNLNFAVSSDAIREAMLRPVTAPTDLNSALGRTPSTTFPKTRWQLGLPFESRVSLRVSADTVGTERLSNLFKRELDSLDGVVLDDKAPDHVISVVALPNLSSVGDVTGYDFAYVVFSVTDPANEEEYRFEASGTIVELSVNNLGLTRLAEGVAKLVAEFEAEQIAPQRRFYERLKARSKESK